MSDNTGIYKITNIKNNHCYIGSAKNLKQRKMDHFKRLRKNTHENSHLQHAFNKYGEDCFLFEIISFCDEYSLIKEEQYCLDSYKLDGKVLYNMRDKAENMLGFKHSPETKEKISKKRKGIIPWNKGKRHSKESIQKMKESKLGNKNPMYGKKRTDEFKKYMSEKLGGDNGPNYGKPLSENCKKKISEALVGENNPMYGKHHSEETKKKISESIKLKLKANKDSK